jgi:hypothetical protein
MHDFSACRHGDAVLLFGGLYVQGSSDSKGCSINSVVRIDLDTLSPEPIRTLGARPSVPQPLFLAFEPCLKERPVF